MIDVHSAQCRHCGVPLAANQLHAAAHAQAVVETAIGQANQQKYVGWTALAFVALEVAICVFSDRIPIYWIVAQAGPAVALFLALKWIRHYGALQTDEPDYPAAQRAMTKVMALWAGVLVVQVVLLIVLGLRVLGAIRL
jgi:hypothetical protein